jgi:hypothetical protein
MLTALASYFIKIFIIYLLHRFNLVRLGQLAVLKC